MTFVTPALAMSGRLALHRLSEITGLQMSNGVRCRFCILRKKLQLRRLNICLFRVIIK